MQEVLILSTEKESQLNAVRDLCYKSRIGRRCSHLHLDFMHLQRCTKFSISVEMQYERQVPAASVNYPIIQ